MILQPATPKSGEDPGGGRTRRVPPKIGKDMIFLRKMVIFHTKYPNNFRASLRSAQFFKVRPPPNLKSWIRPWLGLGLFTHLLPYISNYHTITTMTAQFTRNNCHLFLNYVHIW